jgi:hypothetical protein
MNSRTLLNLLLLLLVVGLSAFIYQRQSQHQPAHHLTRLQADDIHSIVIPRSKGDIVLEKIDGHWQMQSPYQLRAHEFRIERLIDMATAEADRPYDSQDLELETFGIDKHSSSIRFNDTTIRYGNTSPLSNKRYVLVNKQLYLIDDQLYPLINSQPSSFADLALLDSSQHISAIELPELRIFKNEKGSWQAERKNHSEAPLDADSLQTLVENWQSAQAFGVHAYMQRKQLGRIELHLTDNTIIELIISDTSPWLILGRPRLGIEYHFDKSFNERLLKPPVSKTEKPNNNA